MARAANIGGRISPGGDLSAGTAILDAAPKGQAKQRLEQEIVRVAAALQQGRLGERTRADLFQGSDQVIAASVNSMLEALIQPLKMSAKFMERFAEGDIPQKITEAYNGDFNEVK